jgi:3-hydroxybutyryl-CoA dehydrogenase
LNQENMTLDANRQDLITAVIGTGTMGRGIAQSLAQAGIRVRLFDSNQGAVDSAIASIADVLGKQVEKGKLPKEKFDSTLANLVPAASLNDLSDCHVVVEAILENLDVKRELFRSLDDIVDRNTILASNTSSLSIAAMAAGSRYPDRIGGWHFFNPVPLMKIAEVVQAPLTAPWVTDALKLLTQRVGHAAVVAKDMPGFIVNHGGRAFGPEGIRLASEGVADFHVIDQIMRDCAGFRMGPFQLLDLLGLDVAQIVMESLYHQYYEEPRFRLAPFIGQRVAAGLYGRKTQRGFYEYKDGVAATIPELPTPPRSGLPVWISDAEPELAERLRSALRAEGVQIESGSAPSPHALIIVTPLGMDTATCCAEFNLDPRRTVAVDALFPLNRRRTLMCSPATLPEYRQAAHAVLSAAGVPVSVIRDSPGFVAQRIVAQIISIGCDIAQQRIAEPRDIDMAVCVGLGYPSGPLTFGDTLGPARVLKILEGMSDFYQDPRYRPSPWLKRRAKLGLSLFQED